MLIAYVDVCCTVYVEKSDMITVILLSQKSCSG